MCLLFFCVLNVCDLYDAFNGFCPFGSSFTLASMFGRLHTYSIDLLKEFSSYISIFAEGAHRTINYCSLITGLSFSQASYIFSNLIYQLCILYYFLEEACILLSGNDDSSGHSRLLGMFIFSLISNKESTNVLISQIGSKNKEFKFTRCMWYVFCDQT